MWNLLDPSYDEIPTKFTEKKGSYLLRCIWLFNVLYLFNLLCEIGTFFSEERRALLFLVF